MVYNAFSAAVVGGLWHRLGSTDFAAVVATDLVLLAVGPGVDGDAGAPSRVLTRR